MNSFYHFLKIAFYCSAIFVFSSFSSGKYETGNVREFNDLNIDYSSELANTEGNTTSAENSENDHPFDAILKLVEEENRFVNQLDSSSFFSLPVGISLADEAFSFVVYESSVYPDHARFNAFLIVTNPLDGKKVRFSARDVRYSFSGGVEKFRLELVDLVNTSLFNGATMHWLPGTYAEWDCNGLDHIGLKGRLALEESKFVQVNPQTGDELGAIHVDFFSKFGDINDFVLDISVPAFKIKGFDEAYFKFDNAVLDCSDQRNATSFQLPAQYPGDYQGAFESLWRGIYVNEATVFLSSKFRKKNSTAPVSFSAGHLLIDDFGFSGIMSARNILPVEDGSLGTWPFSIQEINVGFLTGTVESFGFSGNVQLPGSNSLLDYSAYFDQGGNYHFGISPGENLDFNVFSATLELRETSRVDVFVENGAFHPSAVLDGNITFRCSKSGGAGDMLTTPAIEFQGMQLSASPPYFDLDYLAVEGLGQSDLAGFPVTITGLEYEKRGELVGFGFTVSANLSPSDGGAISCDGGFSVLADISGENWEFQQLDIGMFQVNTEKEGAFSFHGSLEVFDDDPLYGDGFYGKLEATFGNTFEVDVAGMFGRNRYNRYFFVDALVAFGNTPVPAGPFMMNGFGGGLSYGMKRSFGEFDGSSRTVSSLSGVRYLPDRQAGLGISAALKAGIVNETLVQGNINFGITFNRHGGINQISFYGEAAMISPMEGVSATQMKKMSGALANGDQMQLKSSTPMKAAVSILMDMEAGTFHAEMEVWINVAGAIKGTGPNNRAGWGVFHYEPGKWFLHVGTPVDPVGVEFIGLVKSRSYFMAGHDLPAAMLMNDKVLDILNMSQADFNGERGENDLATGNGLAFGTNIEISTGDITFLMFYGAFDLGSGFDVMLLDMGKHAYCAGSSGPVGINGWYAKGQAYAYFAGKIGIRVKVFGKRKKFDIINIQTAAALRIEGPNPMWMKGAVGGKYRILGGMISGNCNFEVSVGDTCDLRTGPRDLSDMQIIGAMTPVNGTTDLDPFTLPQVVFNMPVQKALKISEDENLTREFRINLQEYSIYQGDQKIEGAVEWNSNKTTLAFTPDNMFDTFTEYRMVASVSFDEKQNGYWKKYKDENGELYVERKEVEFETGDKPEKIPREHVEYTYPLHRMMNFYPGEHSQAYLSFSTGVAPYFSEGDGWMQKARWVPVGGGTPVYGDISYSGKNKEVVTSVPGRLQKGAMYRFELVNVPDTQNADIDQNVKEETRSSLAQDSTNVDVTTRAAEGSISKKEEIVFYSLDFRCSRYSRFRDKIPEEIKATFLYNAETAIDYPGIKISAAQMPGAFEMLDGYEIEGTDDIEPLIRREAIYDEADWFMSAIYPLIYEDYPLHPDARVERDVSLNGLPPHKPIFLWQEDYNYRITDSDMKTGTVASEATKFHFLYGLPGMWASDYNQIRCNLGQLLENGTIDPGNKVEKIMGRYPCPQVDKGLYPIRLEYVLPGKSISTSSFRVDIVNPYDVEQVNLKE